VPKTGLSKVFGPRDVRVALAWSSRILTFGDIFPFLPLDYPLTSILAVDLDLKIYDSAGNQVGYSGSWDNSYEVAQFSGTPGETYSIRIQRWSGTANTWFGIAWTVTGGLLIFDSLTEREFSAVARRLEWQLPPWNYPLRPQCCSVPPPPSNSPPPSVPSACSRPPLRKT
jgi:hypothetical protein